MFHKNNVNPFKRLFNFVVNNKMSRPNDYKLLEEYCRNMFNNHLHDRLKSNFGFPTSGSGVTSRNGLYTTTLSSAADISKNGMRDKPLVDQIAGLSVRKGRVDHSSGGHDDLCIAWLLAHWFLTQANGIDFYGIELSSVLCLVKSKSKISSEDTLEQQSIKMELVELVNLLSKTTNGMMVEMLEHKIRTLDRKLILENGNVFNVDKVIREAKVIREPAVVQRRDPPNIRIMKI